MSRLSKKKIYLCDILSGEYSLFGVFDVWQLKIVKQLL